MAYGFERVVAWATGSPAQLREQLDRLERRLELALERAEAQGMPLLRVRRVGTSSSVAAGEYVVVTERPVTLRLESPSARNAGRVIVMHSGPATSGVVTVVTGPGSTDVLTHSAVIPIRSAIYVSDGRVWRDVT